MTYINVFKIVNIHSGKISVDLYYRNVQLLSGLSRLGLSADSPGLPKRTSMETKCSIKFWVKNTDLI